MVDIVGFSSLTTLATEKSESGAEAIALEIGTYMGECICIIEQFGGDVVKFLGDAVLVCFQPDLTVNDMDMAETIHLSHREKQALIQKAIECGRQLLARQSHYRVYLTAKERSKHRSSTNGDVERRGRNVFGQRFFLFDNSDSDSDNKESSSSVSSLGMDVIAKPDIFDSTQEYSMGVSFWDCIPYIKHRRRRRLERQNSIVSDGSGSVNSIDLELHIALSCGDITNVVLGDLGHHSSNGLNGNSSPQKRRPSTRSADMDDLPLTNGYRLSTLSDDSHDSAPSKPLPYTGRLEYAICGPAVEALESVLSTAKAGEMCITPTAFDFVKYLPHPIPYERRKRLYILKSHHGSASLSYPSAARRTAILSPQSFTSSLTRSMDVFSGRHISPNNDASAKYSSSSHSTASPMPPLLADPASIDDSATVTSPSALVMGNGQANSSSASSNNGDPQLHHPTDPNTLPPSPMAMDHDNGSLTRIASNVCSNGRFCNPVYLKYMSRSALHRLKQSDNDSFPAQFRDVTIMFISLGKLNPSTPSGLVLTQQAVYLCIKILVKYEGALQQFAVDDKGATLLAVFGLPPLSHEREAVFAAKAAVELRDLYLPLFTDFAIALSTGVIFNAVLPQGCPIRRDPAIAGDAIILAVRMLKFSFAKQNVVCDFATKQQIGTMCDFEDYGENFVKGKVKPIMIYGIRKFEITKTKRFSSQGGADKKSDFIGYKFEMSRANRFLDDWHEKHDHHLLIISGNSGVGKSFFCGALSKIITAHEFNMCWSSSTEVEQSSKYYLVKHLLLSLFDIIDSDKVPQNTRKRLSATNNSPSIHTTSTSIHPGDTSPASSMSSIYRASSHTNQMNPPTMTTATPTNPTHHRMQTLNSHSSVTRSSYGAYSTYSPDGSGNEVAELILRCLRKCGEEDGFLPLFKMIFGSLGETEENRYTRRLDGRGRDILLTGVITRMVKYVSECISVILICDDVQWADSASIKILHHIHERCEHVMLVLATRPIKDYNVTFINNFCQTGVSEEILLNGLGGDDIEGIVLRTMNAGVTKVSPEIIRIIQKRTNGNPLHVKNIAMILKDFHHVTVVEGELVPSNNRFEPKDWLQNLDYKRIIKMQYDRLDPNFQEFLTVASCLDQYFTLYEVEAMLKVSNVIFSDKDDMQKILETIEHFDVYNFLQRGSDSTGIVFHPVTASSLGNASGQALFSFSHITIPKSIYGMVSYETRIILHGLLAKFYEGQLTRENYPELLGKVARHYLQTDLLEKQLYYLEALADLNMRSYLLPEATSNLESMVKILNENPGIAYRFGRLHQSDIYRRLGVCFTMRTQLKMGERYLFMALECLGQSWPQTEPEFLYKFWKLRLVQYRHRRWSPDNHNPNKKASLASRFLRRSKHSPSSAYAHDLPMSSVRSTASDNPPPFQHQHHHHTHASNNASDNKKKQTIQRVVEIMEQLSNIYFYTGQGRAFVYSCLVGLNACEALDECGPHYTLFLARAALLCWLNDHKEHSIFYITKALHHMDEKHDSGTLTICALLCFAAGKFKNAKELLYQAIQADKTLGVVIDCQSFYRSVGLVVTMMIFEGTLDHEPEDEGSGMSLLKQMADTARSNGDYEAEIWLGVYHVANAIVVDRVHECESFVVMLEHHVKQAADYNRIAIHGTLLCYYARHGDYDLARKHYKYLVTILPALTITPNIFPIFGLIFATMGLYCMVEDEQMDLVVLEDAKNYDRFIVGVSRLNHAFQQVKFWEFTQPCLYLARALPYISTGRTVEGYTVLRHGIYEMHFIQEIRFLKAYYWACMGKYAFTPKDRIDWTVRAKNDLDILNIPTTRYLNPDPTRCFTNRRVAEAMNLKFCATNNTSSSASHSPNPPSRPTSPVSPPLITNAFHTNHLIR
ncbi:hypothetical protein DM01DRAFT_1311751 [Hesseltinella vesiculosa]|uniref:Guanylate cyclase domain-containing protein n=1 Tax=Hesseltinella vesiculosa TaxID=101127 RepID=A0A1X2G5A5_9FUNG|nr:hypothetical protein DM01DRAFT_1311751 [Hesseltinella vesiculosa]